GQGVWRLTRSELEGLELLTGTERQEDLLLHVTAETLVDDVVLASEGTMRVRVHAFELSVQDAIGAVEQPVPLLIGIEPVAPDTNPYQFRVDVSGMPEGASLSAGQVNPDQSVSLSAHELIGLELIPAAETSGPFALVVTGIAFDGDVEIMASVPLVVDLLPVPQTPTVSTEDVTADEDTGWAPGVDPGSVVLAEAGAIDEATGLTHWTQSGLGDPVYLTYSYSNLLDGTLVGGLSTNEIKVAVEEALAVWSSVAPVHFIEVADSGPDPRVLGNADYEAADHPLIRFGQRAVADNLAVTTRPNAPEAGRSGDVHLDENTTWALSPGAGVVDIRELILHESGHAVGLEHDDSPDAVMNDEIFGRFPGGAPLSLNALDVQAIQALYGAGVGSVTPLFAPAIALPIVASLDPTDQANGARLSLRIENVPEGAALSAGEDLGAGVWWVSEHEIAGLMLRPPQHSDADFQLTVTAVVSIGQVTSESLPESITVTLNAVADAPVIDIAKPVVSGDVGTVIPLPIQVATPDNDGSEAVTITLSGLPTGSHLTADSGLSFTADADNGAVVLNEIDLPGLSISLPEAVDFRLGVDAESTETANNDTAGATPGSVQVIGIAIEPDAYEDDNQHELAKPIAKDEVQSRSMFDANDVDWVSFTLGQDKTELGIRVRSPNNASNFEADNLRLVLYRADDPTSPISADPVGPTGDVTFDSMEKGDYLLRVDDPAGQVSNYTLQLDILEPGGLTPILVGNPLSTGNEDSFEPFGDNSPNRTTTRG
ncbi:MAG: matrixin family metalloprotease, partial [Planctomycetota bacterium]